jgi:hypothetical protein
MRAMLLLVLALVPRPGAARAPAALQGDSLRDAIALGRTHDDSLVDAFNRGYSLSPSGVIEQAEIVTEFRRAVLIVRDHALQGDFVFGPSDVAKALAPSTGLVTFIVQVRLHPMTTLIREPAYDLYVSTGPRTPPLAPKVLKRTPVYPPLAAPGGQSQIVAVRLEASLARADIEAAPAPLLIVTDENAGILWQARIDLTRYR